MAYIEGMNDDSLYDTKSGFLKGDPILAYSSNDNIYGVDGDDYLLGSYDYDTPNDVHGNETFWNESNNDFIWGGFDYIGSNDYLDEGVANHTLWGGYGNDTFYGSFGDDALYGETGDDLLFAFGDDGFASSYSSVTFDKGEGSDFFYSETGNDILLGEPGNEFLVGGGGNDTLEAGVEADTFILGDSSSDLYQGSDYALITDFKYWQGDKLQMRGSASQYSESDLNLGVGTGALDTGIYQNGNLVAVLQDVSGEGFILGLDSILSLIHI